MEDKKQDVKSLEELLKAAYEFRKWAVDFGNKLSKVLPDIEIPEEKEDTWEMKCPYEYGDKHYCIQSSGDVFSDSWHDIESDDRYFSQGNTFPTQQAAELEVKRRNLLTRFRAFRDECNGDWKADWNDYNSKKWDINYTEEGVRALWTNVTNSFSTFGYFKNRDDAKRAIELFGNEIIELYVEGE